MKNIQKLFVALIVTIFTVISANAQVSLSISIGPPALPVYEQPYCPGDGYLWIPGYWAYADSGYYWVPGYWALPPEIGFYWTPGYWDYSGPYYRWHTGYWGRTVGYYGGIDYGYGYGGRGYYGGEWSGKTFMYNTAVTRVNTTVIHNTYVDRTAVKNNIIENKNRASFNGRGGVSAKPTSRELTAAKENHISRTPAQVSHQDAAKADKRQFASANHGRPATLVEGKATKNTHAATPKITAARKTNTNRTVTTRKANHASNNKLKTQQKTVVHKQNQVRVNQQRVTAANEKANEQRSRQMTANNEKRNTVQNRPQHVQQIKRPSPAPRKEEAPRRDDNKERH